LIKDHLPETGGFSSQRLLSELGETVGFRIVPASQAMALTERYSSGLTDVFLLFNGGETTVRPSVFADSIIRHLAESEGKKLILLDEIGGIELLLPEIRLALDRVLDGSVTCLGVLKLESSIRDMCRNPVVESGSVDCHLEFRKALEGRSDTRIIPFIRERADEAEDIIQGFIDRIFT
jgi:nucleoside-triphosphatase